MDNSVDCLGRDLGVYCNVCVIYISIWKLYRSRFFVMDAAIWNLILVNSAVAYSFVTTVLLCPAV